VAVTAEAAGVQPSAMVRFAQRARLRRVLADAADLSRPLVERSASYRERIEQIRRGHRNAALDGPGCCTRRHRRDRRARPPRREVTAAQFQAAIRLLARRVARSTCWHSAARFPVACYLAYALGQLELTTHLLDGVGGMLAKRFARSRRGEVLFAIAFATIRPR
jgi:DNA-binding MurR/RpiR family transcriptional regulator